MNSLLSIDEDEDKDNNDVDDNNDNNVNSIEEIIFEKTAYAVTDNHYHDSENDVPTTSESREHTSIMINENPQYKIEIMKVNESFVDCENSMNKNDLNTVRTSNQKQQHSTIEEVIEETIGTDDNDDNGEVDHDVMEENEIYFTSENVIEQPLTSLPKEEKELKQKRRVRKNLYKTNITENFSKLVSQHNSFVCVECNKTFSSKPNLMRHAMTHDGLKPYQCTICGTCFTQNGSLKTHMLRHTGERPYKCEVCNKKFTRKRVLKIHSRIHTGDKPYQCDQCDEKFRVKDALNVSTI